MASDEVEFWWSGEPIGLSLSRASSGATDAFTVFWGAHGPLGVTLGVDDASGCVVVTKSARTDVAVGDVLLRACGLEIRADNFDLAMATLVSAHDGGGSSQTPLAFARAPAPIIVSGVDPRGLLARAGVSGDMTFELLAVNDRSVRYLSMDQLNRLLHESPRPCALRFARRHRAQVVVAARQKTDAAFDRPRSKSKASAAAAAAAGLALAAAVSVNMA